MTDGDTPAERNRQQDGDRLTTDGGRSTESTADPVTDRTPSTRATVPSLTVIRAVAAAEDRRFEHRHTATRRKRALQYVGLAVILPIIGALLWGAYLLGQSFADGGADGVLNLARWYLPVAVVGYALVSGLESGKQLDEFGARELNLTAVPDRALALGVLYGELRKWAWFYAAAVAPLVAFAVGAESPTTALVAVPAAGLLIAVSVLLGYVIGIAGRIGFDALPVSSRTRTLVGSIASTGGVFVVFAGLGAYAASLEIDSTDPGQLASIAPEGAPPIVLGYYVDLFLVGTPLVESVPAAAIASAAVFLAAVPVLTWAIAVLAPRLWYIDPPTPTDERDANADESNRDPADPSTEATAGTESAATDASSGQSTIGRTTVDPASRREWPWLAFPTGYAADGLVRRAVRSPKRSAHLIYYVLGLSILGVNIVFIPEAALALLGSALVMLGIWLAGGAMGLNPLGEEGAMLEQLVLAEYAPETYVHARILVGLVVGTPLVLAGSALLAVDSLSPATALLAGAYWLALVPASAGLAVGIGTLLPATEPGEIFETFEARPPEKLAQLTHGALTAVAAYGGGQLIVTDVDPLVQWGGLALVLVTMAIAGHGGYRYAITGIAEYGRPRSPDPVYALELVTGLALLGLVCSLTVAEGVAFLVPVSGQELFVLTIVANFAGWAVPGIAYLFATGRSIDFLDCRLPTKRDGTFLAIGLLASIAIYVAQIGATALFGSADSAHPITEEIAGGDPVLLAVFVAIAILIVGPVEEFFFRNVLQKRLAETVLPIRSIAGVSLLFALVHVPVYGSVDASGLVATVLPLFALSLVWGWIYYRTGNLLVPALCHGIYNAIVFGAVYLVAV